MSWNYIQMNLTKNHHQREYEPNKEENDKETVSDDGGFKLIHHPADSIILPSNKPPQDQIKFTIFEESIVERFANLCDL